LKYNEWGVKFLQNCNDNYFKGICILYLINR